MKIFIHEFGKIYGVKTDYGYEIMYLNGVQGGGRFTCFHIDSKH